MKLRRKELFRKYEHVLFYSESYGFQGKNFCFYLLLRPILGWVKSSLLAKGLNNSESESELFILSTEIYMNYDRDKSSIVPYLENQLPWFVSRMIARIEKELCLNEVPAGLTEIEGTYLMDENFYWKSPSILLEDRYIGKCFTRSEKYIINTIIVSDDNKLSVQGLAKKCNMDRKRMKARLSDIKEILQMEESNE